MAKKGKKTSSFSSMRDRMRERAATREQQGRGGVKFNFPEGQEVKFLKIDKKCTKKLDILPYEVTVKNHPAGVEKGDLWYQRTIWVHNNVGPEEKAYLCLKTVGKKCPICDYAAQLQKDPKADEELIKSLRAKEREVFNVIDLDGDPDEVLLWEFSYHLFGKLLEEEIRNADADEEYKAAFADLEGGSTLKVRFEGKKMGPKSPEFFEAKRIDFVERDDYPESILDDVLNLDEILNVLDYEKLEGIFLDTDPEPDDKPKSRGKKRDEEDEEEEETPRRGRKGSSRDEKEEKRPSRRSKKDEEDEEEEKPKRGGKKKKNDEPDIDEMDLDELKDYIEENDLGIRVKKSMDEDEVRELIREAQGESEEEEEEKPKRGGRRSDSEEKPKRGGRSSRGKKDEEEDEEEAPRRGKKDDKKSSKKKKDESEDEPECEGGGTFGVDEGEFDECMECERWDDCKAASSKSKKKRK